MGYGLYLPPFFPPNASYSNNARNVNSDGSLNNNNAYNGNNGVRPAHAENRVTVGNETSSEISGPHKERISRPKKANTRRATPAAALSWQQATRARAFEI